MKFLPTLIVAGTMLPLAALAQDSGASTPAEQPQAEAPAGGDGQPAEGETEGAGDVSALAQANFVNADGVEAGTAYLSGTPGGVLIALEVSNLPAEQWVSFHIHETGECTVEDGFESAGAHFNPADVEHGYLSETGPHAGDMPNQYVGADGVLRASVFNPLVTLDDQNAVLGLSLMIHEHEDDYFTQEPAGHAGARIACAVIAEEPEDAQAEQDAAAEEPAAQ